MSAIIGLNISFINDSEELTVPKTLIPGDLLKEYVSKFGENEGTVPQYLPPQFTDGSDPATMANLGKLISRRLSNGIRLSVLGNSPVETQRGHLRVYVPGGRHAEKVLGLQPGSMSIGSRTMQEGGSFNEWSREQVELFCVDHLIQVEIQCLEDSLVMDFGFPTTVVTGADGLKGTEAALQVVREVLVNYNWYVYFVTNLVHSLLLIYYFLQGGRCNAACKGKLQSKT